MPQSYPDKSYTDTYPSQDQRDAIGAYADKAREIASTAVSEAGSLADRFVKYAKANPGEAAAIVAGIGFVAGGILFGSRLRQSRQKSDLRRILRQATQEAKRAGSDLPSMNQISSWVRANLPSIG